MSFVFASVVQFKKMLNNLDQWLEKAAAHAKTKGFDPNVLLQSRLAPHQYPLLRQVQSARGGAKFRGPRLAGKEAPKHPDTEQTCDEIRARVRAAMGFLETLKAADFEGAEARLIELPFLEGKVLRGEDYLVEMVTP